jgi:hypothetical protein
MRVYEIVPGLYQSPTPRTPEDRVFTDVDGNGVEIHPIIDLEGGIDPVVPQREPSTCSGIAARRTSWATRRSSTGSCKRIRRPKPPRHRPR